MLALSLMLNAWAVAFLTRRYVMARGLPYSPEEDDIILSTSRTADILAMLKAAGYPERSANAVKQRRGDLNRNGANKFRTGAPRSPVVKAATDFETAKADVQRLRQQLADAEQAVFQSRKRLATALAEEE